MQIIVTENVSAAVIIRAIGLCVAALLAGCSSSIEPPQFELNVEGRGPEEISPVQQEEITETLTELFGTPDKPQAPEEAVGQLDVELVQMAAGPMRTDGKGHESGLYRRHCASCHGISGDGAGPTAAAQYLHPRDFRHGIYKYTSTADGAKPVPGDLDRVIRDGLPDTAMPSFDRLSDEHIEALVEYVEYLSIRGETELFLLQLVVDGDVYPVERVEVIEDGLMPTMDLWAAARETHISEREANSNAPAIETPKQLAASIRRGQELFRSKNTQCFQCHGLHGAGDGEQTDLDDHWNKPKRRATPAETWAHAGRFRLPLQRLRPRDFTRGTFHGGNRPIDVYWRIHVGIKGTPMPAVGSAGALKPEEIWHVVHYVRSRAG